ncbi:MAG: ATP-binding protein [Dissulfurispiraceae bacterium]
MQTSDGKKDFGSIRQKAEKRLLDQPKRIEEMSVLDVTYLANELGTHQIELEMQNEEMRRAKDELETSRNRFQELYDLAPVGYFTFDEKGLIREVNLTGADLLGVERCFLIGKHFYHFIDSSERDTYYFRMKNIFKLKEKETSEIKLKRADGSFFYAQMDSVCTGPRYCSSILSDITKRKLAEIELQNTTKQLHKLTAHLQSMREAERSDVAREIHDELGQTLTAIKMDLAMITTKLSAKVGNKGLVEKLLGDNDLINTAIQTVKKLCSSLRPQLLDHFGLEAAVEWQIDEFRKRTDIHCQRIIDLRDVVVEDHLATAIFRILQEALTNIMRHAEATIVQVLLKEHNGNILLKVQDNGKGFVESQSTQPGSFGLAGMQERVRAFGGELMISGTPENGTTITVSIPHKITVETTDITMRPMSHCKQI